MKVGDLIQYKDKNIEGKGIVLEMPEDDHMVLVYLMDECPDYVWEYPDLLEVSSCE
jgi:hypothetical protein